MAKSQAAALAQLIARMRKDADLGEANILWAEELLIVDVENSKKQHQKEVSDKLGEAEGLLKELFLNVDKVKRFNHPQAQETEGDIIQLNERWLAVCSLYQDVYEQINVSPVDKTDSGPVVVQNEEKNEQNRADEPTPTSPSLPTLFRNMMGENNQINMFDDDSLLDWTEIDKGGFGSVYKARHSKMGHDVAIKILHDVSVEASLLKEATFQKVFSCKFVLRVYGMYEGIPPNEKVKQKGIVMEFMTRGSIKDLCKNLRGPPPFPLACRLIQEVASGMRFLHLMGILHRDLKLQNVMLSEELHAKLADFGLCTMSATCCPSNEEETKNLGTLKYMPPEAYDINYKPVRSFDVYSFAIFLWAILSGEEPFPNAHPTRVRKCVAKGQRPPLVQLKSKQAKAGMNDLLDLMQKCWNSDSTQRPTFGEITPMVENVYSKHKSKIIHEVFEVLKKMDTDSQEASHNPILDGKKKIHEQDSTICEPQFNSVLPKSVTPVNATPLDLSNTQETYPNAGVMDTHNGTCYATRMEGLHNPLLDEKDKIHEQDSTIHEALQEVQREGNLVAETHETNKSPQITILDPDTGKDMFLYEAYIQGVIDCSQYLHLLELESDWEEKTSVGPDGETPVLQDPKSVKQDPIKGGKITEYDLQQYKKGNIPISEFATPINSAPLDLSNTEETYPIAGLMDTHTGTCFTIHNATECKLINRTTARRLLEAQAATGGIIDIQNKDRYTVHKAANRGLVVRGQLPGLLHAEKAFTGVEDPTTRRIVSVGEAVQNGWMLKETARRYMVVQLLTGGLVNPKTGGRMSVTDAYTSKMIDSTMMRELQAETTYEKDILDPLTQEKINYKQALDRCKKDPKSGLPMLPTSSKGTGYTTGSNSVKYS